MSSVRSSNEIKLEALDLGVHKYQIMLQDSMNDLKREELEFLINYLKKRIEKIETEEKILDIIKKYN